MKRTITFKISSQSTTYNVCHSRDETSRKNFEPCSFPCFRLHFFSCPNLYYPILLSMTGRYPDFSQILLGNLITRPVASLVLVMISTAPISTLTKDQRTPESSSLFPITTYVGLRLAICRNHWLVPQITTRSFRLAHGSHCRPHTCHVTTGRCNGDPSYKLSPVQIKAVSGLKFRLFLYLDLRRTS